MAEGGGPCTAVICGGCGISFSADPAIPATFCPGCGTCLLNPRGSGGGFHPFVPPSVSAEAAWSRLRAGLVDSERASLTASRLLYVPFHEWPADLGSAGIVRDARGVLAPAADLLPAGFPAPRSPAGDDRRGLTIAATARRRRLADPKEALDLIRQGEAVDAMIPPPDRAPMGAAPGSSARLLYYPLWFLTYRLDYREQRGVVDAATGRPVGASASPRRWTGAALQAAAGAVVFAVALGLAAPLGRPLARIAFAAVASWIAAFLTLSRVLIRERAR